MTRAPKSITVKVARFIFVSYLLFGFIPGLGLGPSPGPLFHLSMYTKPLNGPKTLPAPSTVAT